MNIIHRIALVTMCCITVLIFSNCTNDSQQSSRIYDYPVKPGTDEWKALKNHEERLSVCQIPNPVLKGMTTEALIKTVQNYPFLTDMRAHNFIQQGFESVYRQFNGVRELLGWSDAGKYLMAEYSTMDPLAIDPNWTLGEKGEYACGISDIEVILAQDRVLSKLSDFELNGLMTMAYDKYAEKNTSEIYGRYSQMDALRLMGKILDIVSKPFREKVDDSKTIRDFLAKGSRINNDEIRDIELHADRYMAAINN